MRNSIHRSPAPARPQLRQETPGAAPPLEYFGPGDFVPESPYLLHGGQLHLEPADIFAAAQEAANFETEGPAVKKSILKLEPKPRSLFKYDVDFKRFLISTIVFCQEKCSSEK